MKGLFWRSMKSLSYRTSGLAYRVFPKKAVLVFYCYMAYILRAVAWRLACRYYGPSMAERRGDMPEFVLSQIGPKDAVIDIGCAEGNLTRLIAGKAKGVTAVEIDKRYLDMIDRADGRLKNVTFLNGDIMDLAFDRVFDAAVFIHVIEHMENADAVLRKIAAISRRIIVETPDQESDWLASTLRDLGIEERGDDKHVRLYDASSLKAELERNGWKDIVLSKGNGVVRAVAVSRENGG